MVSFRPIHVNTQFQLFRSSIKLDVDAGIFFDLYVLYVHHFKGNFGTGLSIMSICKSWIRKLYRRFFLHTKNTIWFSLIWCLTRTHIYLRWLDRVSLETQTWIFLHSYSLIRVISEWKKCILWWLSISFSTFDELIQTTRREFIHSQASWNLH